MRRLFAGGIDFGLDFERERPLRRCAMVSRSGLMKQEAGSSALAIERDPFRDEAVSVEDERGVRPPLRIWANMEACGDPRRRGVELDIEIDLVDQIIGGPVIFQANGLGAVGTHQILNLSNGKRGSAVGTPRS